MSRVLLLAGTREARLLATAISSKKIDLIASFAGITSTPEELPCEVRIGGFGGSDGLTTFLRDHHISAVIDATHPYATQMNANALMASERSSVAHLRLLRPAWAHRLGWIHAPDIAAAVKALPAGAHALATTGRKEIAPFAARSDVAVTLRTIEPVPDLPAHISALIDRPPFELGRETDLLSRHTHLVTKNAGGTGTAKLDAAEALGVPVIMVDRPDGPECRIVDNVDDAVRWTDEMLADAADIS